MYTIFEENIKKHFVLGNILKKANAESISKENMEQTRKVLLRKLSFRPTIQELKDKQIIKFNDYVEVRF